jgi:hypothetical protein
VGVPNERDAALSDGVFRKQHHCHAKAVTQTMSVVMGDT